MSTCKFCKSDMVGDGVSTVRHCPNAADVSNIEPDANPVYCESDANVRVHHPYSPSTLQSLEACPCYIGKQSAVEHERTTAGTRAHGVAESGEDDNRLSDEDAAAVAECLDFVEGHRVELEARRIRDASLTGREQPELLEIKEAYLPIDDVILPDGTLHTTAGYCDHALIAHCRTYAIMADWKYGRWFVTAAPENTQGIAYALGLFKKFPTLQRIQFFFKQPLLEHVSEAVFTREQIPALYLRIQTIVARAVAARQSGDFSSATPTVPVCNFCANLGKCPAVAAMIIRVSKKFHPLGVPDDVTPSALHSSRDTVQGLELAAVAACWAKAYKTQVTDRILRGEADIPPGHKIQTKADREIADAEKYKSIALRRLTPGQYEQSCTVVFGKVEGFIKDAAPRGSKKAAIETFNAELEAEGALVKGQPYSFLKAVSTKEE